MPPLNRLRLTMHITAITLSILCGAMILYAISMPPQKAGPYPMSQDAHDAVQDERIRSLEKVADTNARIVAALDSKMNYILGGVAGIYGVMAVGLFSLKVTGRKS